MVNPTVSRALAGVVALGVGIVISATAVQAQPLVASDQPAGLVIFPKVVVDVRNPDVQIDTVIQLTNVSSTARYVHCFLVDGETCVDTDFSIVLTPNMPTGWLVSSGRQIDPNGGVGLGRVPPAPDDVFLGELKCVEVRPPASGGSQTDGTPINSNDLIGQATIYTVATTGVPNGSVLDARAYSGIGVPTVLSDGSDQNDKILCLGPEAGGTGSADCPIGEYAACPSFLLLDHPFDGARLTGPVASVTQPEVTLVACSENFNAPLLNQTTTAQFLVFNEFEQRFSASTRLGCHKEVRLASIDALGQEAYSIWSIGVEGTLVGQTRIRAVLGSNVNVGHGLLGIAEEITKTTGTTTAVFQGSAAVNVNYSGQTGRSDAIRYDQIPLE